MAIARLELALKNFPVLGIANNIPFLLGVIAHPRFRAGDVDTGFLDGPGASLAASVPDSIPPAVSAALAAHELRPVEAGGAPGPHDPWTQLARWRPS
jgi:acetyl/propionyl-CoA carboxylase alpha subunit